MDNAIGPDETELHGIERVLAFLEPKDCEAVTGKPCGAILSDECDACVELEAGIDFLRQMVAWAHKQGVR